MNKPKIPKKISDMGEMTFKVIAFHTITMLSLISQVAVFLLSTRVSFFPSEDSLKSILSSFAEIIAGLYGITLAGYTFFLSRIDGLMASDATLDFVVIGIKKRFKYLIWHITFNVLMTLVISAILMYFPVPTGEEIHFFYRLFCNEFVVFLSFAIVLILYYSVLVIDPNCLEKEARKQKKKLSAREETLGSIVEFISLYAQIEAKCNGLVPQDVLHQIYDNKGKQFTLTLELLQELRPELAPLLMEVRRVHHYYECMVNCTPMTVSQEMCLIAQGVLAQLEKSLDVQEETENKPEMP